jgi:hypothetical protein
MVRQIGEKSKRLIAKAAELLKANPGKFDFGGLARELGISQEYARSMIDGAEQCGILFWQDSSGFLGLHKGGRMTDLIVLRRDGRVTLPKLARSVEVYEYLRAANGVVVLVPHKMDVPKAVSAAIAAMGGKDGDKDRSGGKKTAN